MRNRAIVLLIGVFLSIAFFVAAPEILAQENGKVYIAQGGDSVTFTVNTVGDTLDANPGDGVCSDATGACSLRAAIGEANAFAGADIIMLPPGTYRQTIVAANEDANAGGDWDITSVMTIRGSGEFSCAIEAATSPGIATERVLNVRSGGDLALSRVMVRNGRFSGTMSATTRGAGIENLGVLTLNNVIVRDNEITSNIGDPFGAGIHNAGTAMTLISSAVTGNTISRQTGGSSFGGGIASTSETTITITNCYIGNNNAFANGGFAFGSGLYLENRFTINMSGAAVAHNLGAGSSGTNGSGVSAISNAGAAVLNATGCTFRNNSGGGQTGGGQGSGLYFLTTTTAGATLTATLNRVSVKDNIGNSPGGGIGVTINGGNLNINILNSSITRNVGGVVGGGIWATDAGPRFGAGQAAINLTNTTISNNAATNGGGGVYLQGDDVTANLNHVTVAGNEGGLGTAAATINLKNSIVGDNTDGGAPDVRGLIISGDYNHIENMAGATITGTTTHNTTGDSLLGLLVEHVGGTVHLPGSSSPVLNSIPSGINDCGTTILADQRGVLRPQGGACDKGSVERSVSASIGGRVFTSNGRAIRNAVVTLSGGNLPHPLVTRTGSFGWYYFPDLPGEETYTLTASAKRFEFPEFPGNFLSIYLIGDTSNLDFVAESVFGMKQE
jgi:CSLREA domain-containing protein